MITPRQVAVYSCSPSLSPARSRTILERTPLSGFDIHLVIQQGQDWIAEKRAKRG
jgi:hypothetical protein